jgi:thiamine biosynthesis protein ThiS
MTIEVNTAKVEWVEGETIVDLLRRMNFIYPMLVIKIDGAVIPKSRYAEMIKPDGSVVEVIHLESGG